MTTMTFRRLAALGIALGARVRLALRLRMIARHEHAPARLEALERLDAHLERGGPTPTSSTTHRQEGGWSLDLSDDD